MRYKLTLLRYWLDAFWYEPTWPLCRWCKWRLLTADDCGWFNLQPERDQNGLTCMHCMHHSEAGRKHYERFGWGER
jgi:hypothetical protein